MSAGQFVISKYNHIDGTRVSKILVQEETLALTINGAANTAATGDVTTNLFVKVSKTLQEIGTSPMKIRLKLAGNPPAGYSTRSKATLPLLNSAIKAQARAATQGTVINYLDTTWTFVGIQEEDIL